MFFYMILLILTNCATPFIYIDCLIDVNSTKQAKRLNKYRIQQLHPQLLSYSTWDNDFNQNHNPK